MKGKKTKNPAMLDLLDALADVVAERVATRVVEATKPVAVPEKVPAWLSGPKRPRGARHPPISGEWTPEKALRSAGLVTIGDPGYDDALKKYLDWKRSHDAELRGRARLRTAARLLGKLLDGRDGTSKPTK